jgi:hypothetical protein
MSGAISTERGLLIPWLLDASSFTPAPSRLGPRTDSGQAEAATCDGSVRGRRWRAARPTQDESSGTMRLAEEGRVQNPGRRTLVPGY